MLALFDKLISRPRFRSLLSTLTFQKEFEYFRNGEVPHEEYKDPDVNEESLDIFIDKF
jgi:hypothetical protein